MKRFLLAACLAAGLVLGATPATGVPPERGPIQPACAEIGRGGGFYVRPTDSAPGSYSPQLSLWAPSCRGLTYTIYVLDGDEDGSRLLASQSVRGNGSDILTFDDMVIDDDDPNFCVYATASAGAHVFHRVPEDGCTRTDQIGRVDYWWFP